MGAPGSVSLPCSAFNRKIDSCSVRQPTHPRRCASTRQAASPGELAVRKRSDLATVYRTTALK